LLAGDPIRYGRAYNFGPRPDDHLTVSGLVDAAIAEWGQGSWLDRSTPDAPHEAALLHLDISLAGEDLQWIPRLDAGDAIRWTLEWYRQPGHLQAQHTFHQIKSYFSQ
jgi:CDP-glucose 4,6-dehydratase